MTNTKDKLNEAKHFLEEMKRVSSNLDKFRYELTAFLAASRSLTQIMQKEFSGKNGFIEWYSRQQNEMENNPTLKYLLRQRNNLETVSSRAIGVYRVMTEVSLGDRSIISCCCY